MTVLVGTPIGVVAPAGHGRGKVSPPRYLWED